MIKNAGVIKALFLNMGKTVVPYFKMTAELAEDMHKTFAKLGMYIKDKNIQLTKKQQEHITNQLEQLRLYDEKTAAKLGQGTKGPKAEVIELSEKLPAKAPYSKKNPKGWMPTDEEVGFNQNLVDDTVELLMSKSDPKSFQNELVNIMTRKGTYADYSEAEIKAILDTIHPEKFAKGGQVGLNYLMGM